MARSIKLAFVFFILFGFGTMYSQDQKVFITRVKNADNSIDFNYIKEELGTYFVEIELEKTQNVADSLNLKKIYNLNLTEKSGTLFKLIPANKNKEILCSYSFSYKKGFIKPQVDNSIPYILPFEKNKKITIHESIRFNVKPEIWKNYLVYSQTKDTIFAMRKGIVVGIRKFIITNNENSRGKNNMLYRTEVIVEHADGTNASYSGLDEKSLFVKLDQTVYPHTRIGLMDDLVDRSQNHSFKFNVYYFSDEETEDLGVKKNKVIEKSVMPDFITEKGNQKLNSESEYIVTYDESAVYKEMTSEEKSKYKSRNLTNSL